MIIGTAGHIDHGKSALVKALTGIDPDRLKEEQLRGITIDLGFAHLPMPDGTVVGIVDVPGHERLVHNMLAGAGGVDIAAVVVAGDEGVKPQTVEHVEILDLLGVSSAIGIITKIDLVGSDERAVARLELEELLGGTSLSGAPIVEVSSVTGEGVDALRLMLQKQVESLPRRPIDRPFRLPLDRVFTLQGFGTVVTGTAIGGRVTVGQTLDVLPAGGDARVRSIEVHGTRRDEASAGERVALNVAGRKLHCVRGFALAEQGVFAGTTCLDCVVHMLRTGSARTSRGLSVRLYVGTSEIPARVVPLQEGVLTPGGQGYVQIRTREPLPAARGDRFVLRSEDDRVTLGGGTVLDAFAPRRGPRRGQTALGLRAVDGVNDQDALEAFLAGRRVGATLREAARFLNVRMPTIERLVSAGHAAGTVARAADGTRVMARSVVDRLCGELEDAISAFHAENPLKPAMSLAELRTKFDSRMAAVMDVALLEMNTHGTVIVEANAVRLATHEVAFDPAREMTRQRVLETYQRAGLQPPARAEVVSALAEEGLRGASEVVDSLLDTGTLVSLSHELLVDAQALAEARDRLIDHLRSPEGVTVGRARELLGTTRKYLVPLFELFDRQGFTVRRGDVRILSPRWGVSQQTGT